MSKFVNLLYKFTSSRIWEVLDEAVAAVLSFEVTQKNNPFQKYFNFADGEKGFVAITVALAQAGRGINKTNWNVIFQFWIENFNHSDNKRLSIEIKKCKNTKPNYIFHAKKLADELNNVVKLRFLQFLYRFASADSLIEQAQYDRIQLIAIALKINQKGRDLVSTYFESQFNFQQKKYYYIPDNEDNNSLDVLQKRYYDILQIKQDATDELIKKAYRKLVLLYHPDRNSTKSEAEIKYITQQFFSIQEAYHWIKNHRNIK